jgi:cyanoexosortase B-associated protein
MKTVPLSKLSQIILLLFLFLLLAVGAVPGYIKGKWSWQQPARVTQLKQIKKLQKDGLTLPGWQTTKQITLPVGGHQWSLQQIQRDSQTQAMLLLRPQQDHKEQPQVEWVDLNGLRWWQSNQPRQWQTDEYKRSQFTIPSTNTKVEAQFFRTWIQERNFSGTFAVLQWYAWPGGGNPDPSRWFWGDQIAQWHNRRLPWVGVSIMVPIEPLGDIEKARPTAESLGQTVQAALTNGPFQAK